MPKARRLLALHSDVDEHLPSPRALATQPRLLAADVAFIDLDIARSRSRPGLTSTEVPSFWKPTATSR